MDSGTWMLKCQSCAEIFELELDERDRIIEYAQAHPCPSCQTKPEPPDGGESPGRAHWHHVIGFKSVKNGLH